MKKYITLLFFFAVLTNCRAQMPIYDLEDLDNIIKEIPNSYRKDTKKQLEAYEGTYVYTNGTTTWKIVLQKKKESYNRVYFEDLLIGEYQYIENGIEKVNTLNKLNTYYEDQNRHSISSNQILTGKELGCPDCSSTEKRLRGGLIDPNYHKTFADIQIRRVTVNGKAAITLSLYWVGPVARKEGEILPQPFIAPGTYTLIKQ
ncbi:DUF6705 family protein [Flavobacterium denitrificans]|uniref:DUF6705 family protein n=1 Tax=Flavobacterium denitrificans TaxID=281361 RepID=UPI0003F7DF0A|nr:DUF6705 family protein [Flavobacterium denitrificans]